MMSRKYFDFCPDLSSYEVEEKILIPEVLNVGWLSNKVGFNRGKSPAEFSNKLKKLIQISYSTQLKLVMGLWRSQPPCPLCGMPSQEFYVNWENEEIKTGIPHAEIWIPSIVRNKTYYSSSTFIIHYIMHHNYLPPDEYIESVLSVDESAKIDANRVALDLKSKAYLLHKNGEVDAEYLEYLEYVNLMKEILDR